MLRLSQAGDYAIRGVMHLVSYPPGEIVLVREVAERCDIPRAFLAKIFQTLARSGVLKSHQGSGGGFSLARPPEEISLLEVVEAIEGKIVLHQSILDQSSPEDEIIGKVWREAQDQMLQVLDATSMAQLVRLASDTT